MESATKELTQLERLFKDLFQKDVIPNNLSTLEDLYRETFEDQILNSQYAKANELRQKYEATVKPLYLNFINR